MKKIYLQFFSVITVLLLLSACPSGGGGGGESLNIPDPDSSISISAGTNYTVETLTDTGSYTYTNSSIQAGDDIYFIFTNYSDYNLSSRPYISQSSGSPLNSSIQSIDSASNKKSTENDGIIALRGSSKLDEKYKDFMSSVKKSVSNFSSSIYTNPVTISASAIGDTNTLQDDVIETAVPATLRGLVELGSSDTTFGAKTLEVWVEDEEWGSSGITQEMVDALCNAFLTAGLDNDIYDWVTGIYGEEWGNTGNPVMIGETDTIVIFLHDIEGDGVPGQNESRIVGYFYALHNYTAETYADSDECIRFSLDSSLLAEKDDSTWEITDYWPQECISTLAHEFQHMIHFYQKQELNNVEPTDTWLNEMCSLVTEDFVANKISADGPRGIAYDDPSDGGTTGVISGRLPLYNYWNEASLTQWGLLDDLISYSHAYSFGAYLARNFGGADLFRSMVQNSSIDSQALLSAITDTGSPAETMESLLIKWGVAVVLSDDDSSLSGTDLHYNIGSSWEESALNSITYQLGSIDFNNYHYSSDNYDGPYFYDDSGYVGYYNSLAQSNIYCYAGSAPSTGTYSWNVNVPQGTRMTMVIK